VSRLAGRGAAKPSLTGDAGHLEVRRAAALRGVAAELLSSRWLIALAIAVGVVLRLRQYVADRSLWLDESFLALNIISRGPRELLGVLDFNQGAPPGFMLVEGAVRAISRDELWLRLPAFAAGVAALGLTWAVARRCCAPQARVLGCALVALSPVLVYYGTELKQYAVDVAASLFVVLAALWLYERPTRRVAVATAGAAILAVLCSHAAVFAAAGAGAVLAGVAVTARPPVRGRVVAVVAVWALACAASAADALRTVSSVRDSYGGSSSGGFVSVTGSGGGVGHSVVRFGNSVTADLGLPSGSPGFWLVTVPACAIGLLGFVAAVRRRRVPALILVSPVVVTFVVSALGQYPLSDRAMLFLAPMAALFLAEGAVALAERLPRAVRIAVVVAIAAALLAYPAQADWRALVHPTQREPLRPVLDEIATSWRPGDTLYLTYAAQYAARYYAECDCADTTFPWPSRAAPGGVAQWTPALRSAGPVIVQPYLERDWPGYLRLLRSLPPGRVWIVVSHHADETEDAFLRGPYLAALDRIGTRVRVIDRGDARAYLYEIRSRPGA
jgi:hypothetical protein